MSNIGFKEFLIRSKFNIKKAKLFQKNYAKIINSGLFDEDFYVENYPHILEANMDPLIHYLFYGYKENKLPSSNFNLKRYLVEYPEIKINNINPLLHYIDNQDLDFKHDINPFLMNKNDIIKYNEQFLTNYEFKNEPLISIIILNKDGIGHLKRLFVDFDKKTNYSNYEIIVVDNASKDNSVNYLKSLDLPITLIENDVNESFSKGNNDAVKIANGDYLLFLNNDIEPTYGWLNEMMGCMLKNENIFCVGAKLIFPLFKDFNTQEKSFTIQHAGVKFREVITNYIYGPYHENIFYLDIFSDEVNTVKEVIANTAACLLVSKAIFNDLNGFDENYFYGYEDIDLAIKAYNAGYKSIYNPKALLFHHESATRVLDEDEKNRINYQNIMFFYNKWKEFMFKEMLKDKLLKNYFFTEKTLDISIICDIESDVIDVINDLKMEGYNVELIQNSDNLDIGKNCDILISLDANYEIKKVNARFNLIKILISNKDDDEYDIILDKKDFTANNLLNIIKKTYLE